MKANQKDFIAEIQRIPGLRTVLEKSELQARSRDRTGRGSDSPLILTEPESTEQVQSIIEVCRKFKIPVVPQGGRTGYAGAASSGGDDLLLSLGKMNHILELDPYLPALRVEAGCITQEVQEYAIDQGYYFPVDFASAGSSQIGGNAATNAGGIRFIRYGGMRNHILGLKAVTGAGEILEFSGEVLKDNTGYNLKELLVGSEGTLAIITELTVALSKSPPSTIAVLCAHLNFREVLELLSLVRKSGLDLYAFEFFDQACLEQVLEYNSLKSPFSEKGHYYSLLEFSVDSAGASFLESGSLMDVCRDALPADSNSGIKRFWSYRENISESLSHGPVHKNDISIPLRSIPEYVEELEGLLKSKIPNVKCYLFGHIGDGNIHINLKPTSESENFEQDCSYFDELNTELIQRFHGSISAEHGIGTLKKESLKKVRSPYEMQLMRDIKTSFDPDHILNPGKIFDMIDNS